MKPQELLYFIATSMLQDIGPIKAKHLISYLGSPEQIFKDSTATLSKIPNVGQAIVQAIKEQDVLSLAEKELDYIIKNNINVLTYVDNDYPYRMKNCEDSPLLFFFKGDIDFNNGKFISIVGTRNATDYGKTCCRNLVKSISKHNPVIVSGLAFGIDICAHKEALANGLQTIAVLGTQLGQISPTSHIEIAKNISKQGCVLSEYHSQTKFDSKLFVRRNRIIAALSDATIVVESKTKGGALITADFANQYNRDVCAFPGNIGNRFSQGCNQLIKENKAALIESGEDLEKLLNWDIETKTNKNAQKELFVNLSDEEQKIVSYLNTNPEAPIDKIAVMCEIPMSKLSSLLLSMEFKGLVCCLPGKCFKNT
ncbi:MAG: DNA-processing protein DprA [Bacteroidales bacterium]|nr:DNA-processing protein DprA [Bacteroidales bacterium]